MICKMLSLNSWAGTTQSKVFSSSFHRVILSLTYYSYIVSDIPPGSIYSICRCIYVYTLSVISIHAFDAVDA